MQAETPSVSGESRFKIKRPTNNWTSFSTKTLLHYMHVGYNGKLKEVWEETLKEKEQLLWRSWLVQVFNMLCFPMPLLYWCLALLPTKPKLKKSGKQARQSNLTSLWSPHKLIDSSCMCPQPFSYLNLCCYTNHPPHKLRYIYCIQPTTHTLLSSSWNCTAEKSWMRISLT